MPNFSWRAVLWVCLFATITGCGGGGSGSSGDSGGGGSTVAPAVAPSNLVVTLDSSNSCTLRWSYAGDSGDMFMVYKGTTAADVTTVVGPVDPGILEYTVTGLAYSTTHYFQVKAYNSKGMSNPSNTASIAIPAGSPSFPPAPSNLQAAALSSTNVKLTWSDNSNNEDGFKIYRGTSVSNITLQWTVVVGTTTFTDTSASPNTNYIYRVTAYNSTGESGFAETPVSTPSPPTTKPNPPTGLTGIAPSGYSVQLNWTDASNNEDGFKIYRGTTTANIAILATVVAGTAGYTDNTVGQRSTFIYRVTAFNVAGESDPAQISVTTPAAPPNPPTNLIATPMGVNTVRLDWTVPPNGGGAVYKIYRGATSTNVTTWLADVPGPGSTTYTDNTASPGTTCYYKVTSYTNVGGESAPSNVASATIPTGSTTIPNPPSNAVATAVSSTQINLAWSDQSNNESGFRIYRSSVAPHFPPVSCVIPNTLVGTVPAGATAFTNTGLVANNTYCYRVTAYNTAGESTGAFAGADTPPFTIPNPPSNLIATPASSTKIDLAWSDQSNNEDGFRIYRGASSTTVTDSLASVGAGVTAYADTSVVPSTTYYYKITSYTNGGGESASSNVYPATTPSGPAPTTGTLRIVNNTHYAMYSIQVNGVEKIPNNGFLPLGNSMDITLNPGTYDYYLKFGTKGTGALYLIDYFLRDKATIASGTRTTVDVNPPITVFLTNGNPVRTWRSDNFLYEGEALANIYIDFNQDGTWKSSMFRADGLNLTQYLPLPHSGTVTVVEWLPYAFSASIQLAPSFSDGISGHGAASGVTASPGFVISVPQNFYLRNGPWDSYINQYWILQYMPIN